MWALLASGSEVNRRFIDSDILGKLEVSHELKRFSRMSFDVLCLVIIVNRVLQ